MAKLFICQHQFCAALLLTHFPSDCTFLRHFYTFIFLGLRMRLSQVSRNLTKLLDIKSLKLLDNYAQFNPSPLSMKQMLEFGRTATEVESYQVINGNYPIHPCPQIFHVFNHTIFTINWPSSFNEKRKYCSCSAYLY